MWLQKLARALGSASARRDVRTKLATNSASPDAISALPKAGIASQPRLTSCALTISGKEDIAAQPRLASTLETVAVGRVAVLAAAEKVSIFIGLRVRELLS